MNVASLFESLKAQFGARIAGADAEALDPWIEVTAEGLVEVCQHLKQDPELQFDMLHCVTAIDFLHTDPKKAAKSEWQPHLEILYHLSSLPRKHRVVLKVKTSRWKDDQAGQPPEVPSVSVVWKTALWHEREVYDLSGVVFTGHPDLRRILCPEDWVGHPLRKDYEMPLEYHGIRGR